MEEKKQAEPQLAELAVQAASDSERWFADQPQIHNIVFHALALSGEVGEFNNILKKVQRGSLDPKSAVVQKSLQMELTDVLTYVLIIAAYLNVDLYKAYCHKRAINNARFTLELEGRTNGKPRAVPPAK
jgi:NTP pyrophosphatase (non-canonical NTP hydrolase)